MSSKISQSEAIAVWQKELNKLATKILNSQMTEGEASKYLMEETKKLLNKISEKIDYSKEVKIATQSYYNIYQKQLGKEALDKQILLATDIQKEAFDKLLKDLPKDIRDAIVKDMKLVSNIVSTGQTTKEQATKQVLGSSGGMTIQTPKQGRWKLQNMLNLQMRETLKDTCLNIAENIGGELNTDVYYIPAHAGARPGCYPSQEKFYHDGEDTRMKIDGKMVQVYNWSKLDVGIFPAMFDIRCRHLKFPVTPDMELSDIHKEKEGSLTDIKDVLNSKQVLY